MSTTCLDPVFRLESRPRKSSWACRTPQEGIPPPDLWAHRSEARTPACRAGDRSSILLEPAILLLKPFSSDDGGVIPAVGKSEAPYSARTAVVETSATSSVKGASTTSKARKALDVTDEQHQQGTRVTARRRPRKSSDANGFFLSSPATRRRSFLGRVKSVLRIPESA